MEVTKIKETWPKAALTLAGGGSNTDAAKAAGVSKRTVLRWRADEVIFADQVETLRNQIMTETAGLLAYTTAAAARKLAEIIDDDETRHALTASRVVLDLASRYRMDQVLEHRIATLEMAAGLRQNEANF